ncbi:MAG: nucleotidyltransferase domain-containing protein [Clostridia bacterium]|nr:nucleotidyltransferase domain-containing protein [Clostridia bacterium]
MANTDIRNEVIKQIVEKYAKLICENYNVEAIILFGSCAKGTNNEDSDIDIAIITDDFENDLLDEELVLMRLRRDIDTRIEPHLIRINDYKNQATPFIKEVYETGIKVA